VPETLRVLYVSSFGSFSGGGQHSLDLLIRSMVDEGVTSIVVAPEEGDFLESLRGREIETHVLELPRMRGLSILSMGASVSLLRRFLEEKAVQIVHTDGPRSTILFGRAARALSIPVVYHVRVSAPESRLYERILVAHADALICVSSGAAERFERHRGDKVNLIPNGVDLDLFHPGIEPSPMLLEYRKTGEEILIGEVAFITPAKGQGLLISAAAALDAELRSRLKILFIGSADPEYLDQLEKEIVENGLEENAAFVGGVDDIRPILAGLDAVALPSKSEGLPRSLIEAAAMHLPLIASDIPGCRDVVVDGENGYLCQFGDVSSWTRALRDMILEQDRAGMGAKSRGLAEKRFDAKEVSRRVLEVYEGLLER